jgi:hypothetical protein
VFGANPSFLIVSITGLPFFVVLIGPAFETLLDLRVYSFAEDQRHRDHGVTALKVPTAFFRSAELLVAEVDHAMLDITQGEENGVAPDIIDNFFEIEVHHRMKIRETSDPMTMRSTRSRSEMMRLKFIIARFHA